MAVDANANADGNADSLPAMGGTAAVKVGGLVDAGGLPGAPIRNLAGRSWWLATHVPVGASASSSVGSPRMGFELEAVRATLNCYLWTCTKAVPKIQDKAS